jgi:hypothetical protein
MADASVLRIRLMFSELVRDLDMAIAFYEAARPVRKNLHIAQYFGGTDAAATVATLRFAGELQTKMAMLRLWDGHPDANTTSLVTLARHLKADDLLDALATAARNETAHLWGSKIGDEVRAEIVKWRSVIERNSTQHLKDRLRRLRAYRNKRLAHRNPFDVPGNLDARTAEWRDVIVLIGRSRRIIRELRPCIEAAIYDPRDWQRMRRQSGEAFWGTFGTAKSTAAD